MALTIQKYVITETYDATIYHSFIVCKQLTLSYSGTTITGVYLGRMKEITRLCAMLQFAMKGAVLLQIRTDPNDRTLISPLATNQLQLTAYTTVLNLFKLAETFAEDDDDIATTSFGVNETTSLPDINHFVIRSHEMTLAAFIESYNKLMEDIGKLVKLCLLDFDVIVNFDEIYDNVNSREPNYWFGADKRSVIKASAVGFRKMICSRFVRLKTASDTNNGNSAMDQLEIKYAADVVTWLQSVERLRDLLLTAIHIQSGQPARGTELQTLQVRNRMNGAEVIKRNVVWLAQFKAFALLPTYNKSWIASKIVRFVIGDLREPLVIYLVLLKEVKAFIESIKCKATASHIYEMKTSDSDYLFVGADSLPLSAKDIRLTFVSVFRDCFGVELTFSDYRQLATMLTNAIQGVSSPLELAEKLRDVLKTGHAQAGHSILTSYRHYDIKSSDVSGTDRIQMIAYYNWTYVWVKFISSGERPGIGSNSSQLSDTGW